MTLQQIRYCLTIAQTGSMNRAAEQLYVTQPALTGAIQELEQEVGVTIFNRTNRGVTLTNDGRRFLHYARQVYQQYELMEQEYLRPKKRIFGVSTQHYSFVTKAFVETVRQFDATRFEYAIRETRTIDVIHDVAQRRSDIGILFRSKHNRTVLNKLFAETRWWSAAPMCTCGRGTPWRKTSPSPWTNYAPIPACASSRETRAPPILPRKFSRNGNIPR